MTWIDGKWKLTSRATTFTRHQRIIRNCMPTCISTCSYAYQIWKKCMFFPIHVWPAPIRIWHVPHMPYMRMKISNSHFICPLRIWHPHMHMTPPNHVWAPKNTKNLFWLFKARKWFLRFSLIWGRILMAETSVEGRKT